MSRERIFLLIGIVAFFGALAGGYIWWRVYFSDTHFRVGSVPPELVNQLLPKNVPLESMRPPAVRTTDQLRYGGATSVFSVIEFGDFQCEFCRQLAPEIRKALEPYDGMVRFVWRDFPIENLHKQAMPAAIFARCAGAQGKFWDTYDALMASPKLDDAVYRQIATRVGLNTELLNTCRKDPNVEAVIRKDVEEAKADGVQSAPFLFIGTRAIDGFIDAQAITDAIEASRAAL